MNNILRIGLIHKSINRRGLMSKKGWVAFFVLIVSVATAMGLVINALQPVNAEPKTETIVIENVNAGLKIYYTGEITRVLILYQDEKGVIQSMQCGMREGSAVIADCAKDQAPYAEISRKSTEILKITAHVHNLSEVRIFQ